VGNQSALMLKKILAAQDWHVC